ncbi:DUF2784 domain-containing protein [Pseudomonas sp. zfem002]|uniref:DUF2784 domain-containing protein n=1 Tax=Pseudomonas sp. zfem002 TaxID=3078197 RepID=UPI002927D619|nr:DUF2784 domain-containing protein [Pseudomonas sp. zfem002]MDU9392989.1 DUF2784 domain-containing protein [Pseudomonas sp. zfem002]
MLYRIAADGLVLLHLLFILFAVGGAVLLIKWPRLCWLHLPAAGWGFLVEVMHWPCPLTDWENRMRQAAGEQGYAQGFIEHYLLPVIYPAGLTPGIQVALGITVLLVNLGLYTWLYRRRR